MSDAVSAWAAQLGMAPRTLFPRGSAPAVEHFAMLDGRRGSFALSDAGDDDVSSDDSRNWQWSADLGHHVLIRGEEIHVRSGREPQNRRFVRSTVERELDTFLKYLQSEQTNRLPDLIPYLIEELLQIWAQLPNVHASGTTALATFLAALYATGETDSSVLLDRTWRRNLAVQLHFEARVTDALESASEPALRRASMIQQRAPIGLRLVPDLVIRHAGGRLFQEAHAYIESAQLGLFGDATVVTAPAVSPSGAYFTPVPLARILTEAVLAKWSTLPAELTIADYACGSAVFLVEALHALEERGFTGTVTVVGRDISPAAIVMARTAIAAARAEVTTSMNVTIDVGAGDIVANGPLPSADVVLMNPPFRSWERMGAAERDWVRVQLSGVAKGRPRRNCRARTLQSEAERRVGHVASSRGAREPNHVRLEGVTRCTC